MAKTNFVDANPSQGILGTLVTASFLNKLGLHRHDGLDDDGHGVLDYYVAGGTANALTITCNPPLTAHIPGMPIYIKITSDNTGPVTINVDGLGAVPLTKFAGAPLAPGDLPAGQIIEVTCNSDMASYSMLSPVAAGNRQGVINVSAATALSTIQSGSLVVLSGSTSYTTALPSPAVGREFGIVNLGSVPMTLSAGGSNFTGGGLPAPSASITLPSGGSIDVVGNGSNWCVISLIANTYTVNNPGVERLSNGLTRMWGTTGLQPVGNYNAQVVGGTTFYTHFYQIFYPLAFVWTPFAAICTLASPPVTGQCGMAGCNVTCNLNGGGYPLQRLDVAVTTPVLGLVPTVHWEVIGA